MENKISVICAIVKNEQRFIREWVLHYLNIGFDKLYIYEDYGSRSHRSQLEDLIAENKVELTSLSLTNFIPPYKGTRVQRKLYEKFLIMCKRGQIKADWVGFFDVDEFLMFEDGWNLDCLEKDFEDKAGIRLAWKMYGANGHIKRPRGNVVDNYTTHLPLGTSVDGRRWSIKSFVNVKNCPGMVDIHLFRDCLNTDYSNNDKLVFKKAWLNHYFTKSWEDYLDRIFARGNMQNNYRCLDGFFVCNPNMLPNKKEMVFAVRYRHTQSTMWISRDLKLISGGNVERLKKLQNKYIPQ